MASVTLLAGAIGHFLVVDLSLWILEAKYVRWIPESVLPQMRATVITWGLLGQATFFNAFAGFSLWVGISLATIGVYNWLIFRLLPPGHELRMKSLFVGVSASAIFFVVAALCFIYPAAVGGLLAVAFFILAIKKERTMSGGGLDSINL